MKNMMLIGALVATEQGNMLSFRLVPITQDCPYLECQFDIHKGVLSVILKDTIIERGMVPRLDQNGEPQLRPGRPVKDKPEYQMHKVEQVVQHIFHILFPPEIEEFIELFAINSETYNWRRFFEVQGEEPAEAPVEQEAVASKIEIVKN
jgi:hypothetical protein